MNQWDFVFAAYALVLGVTAVIVFLSWRDMRRAEADADAVRDRQ